MDRREFLGIVTLFQLTTTDAVLDARKFCPACQQEGRKSSVYMSYCMTTLVNPYAYWDEDGNYHYEDPNRTTCHYRCSNGHEWND